MLCGIVLFKTGLIDDKTVPKLSNILLMLVSPLMIFQSYQMDFDGHLMWGLVLHSLHFNNIYSYYNINKYTNQKY